MFKVFDYERISKYKNCLAKGYATNSSEEVFIITKVNNTVLWKHIFKDFNKGGIRRTICYEKELQKSYQNKFRIEKVSKKKVINCTSNGKIMIYLTTVVLNKR